jgi:DNA-binding response OmpR family regulator
MKRILVVDDEPAVLNTLCKELRGAGYEVITAADGEAALAAARAQKPDLILMDLLLPKLDGWQVCQELKRDPAQRAVPIVMFSGLIEKDYERQASEMGDAFLAKPVDFKKLLPTVRLLLKESAAAK